MSVGPKFARTLFAFSELTSTATSASQLLRAGFSSVAKRNFAPATASASIAPSGCPFHERISSQKCPIAHSSPTNATKSSTATTNSNTLQSAAPFESIPTPRALPVVGTLFDLIRSGGAEYVHKYCDNRHTELGPIYRERLGNVEAVFLSDPKLIQKVYKFEGKFPEHMVPEPWIIYNQSKGIQRGLFFMNGEEWRARRRTLNKVFMMPSIISEYTGVFNEVITDMLHSWSTAATSASEADGKTHASLRISDLEKQLYNWSIESLGTMIFGRRLGCIASSTTTATTPSTSPDTCSMPNATTSQLPDIHDFVHCVQQIFVQSAAMQLIPPKIAYSLKLPVWRRFEAAAGKALDLALQYVHENAERIREGATGPGQGIIGHLLEDGEIELDEASRIIVDLFIAAADTTSHATQWALYLLSRNTEVQEKLFQEIESVTQGAPVEEHHLEKLSYVKGVIKEALRLYPVAPFLTRYLPEDLNLSGYRVPKGQLVVMSIFTTGRSDENFDSPKDFKPERWVRNPETGRHQVTDSYAALPFGLGVRSCIGRRVAEVQMQFFLSRIVQQFRVLPTSESEVDIKLRMITTPEKAIDLIVEPRQ